MHLNLPFSSTQTQTYDAGEGDWESWAQGADAVLGREMELARVLKEVKDAGVTGVHSISADVHYQAVINYHPDNVCFLPFPCRDFITVASRGL